MKPFTTQPKPTAKDGRQWSKSTNWVLAIAALGAVTLTPSLGAAPVGPPDEQIEFAVDRALLFESSVNHDNLTVSVTDGVAELEGTVDTLLNRDRAIKVAQQIRGVRSVIDRLLIEQPDTTDAEILIDVREALLFDPATEAFEVDPVIENGHVTLNGEVSSWHEKQLVSHEVKAVRGVVAIDNKLDIVYPTSRSDAEIKADVTRALTTDIWVNRGLIDVSVDAGEVVLTGTVGSVAEADIARSLAWTTGVKFVDIAGLEIEPWMDISNERDRPARLSDDEIKAAIGAAIDLDPRVSFFDPWVSVENGVVTLVGTVDNLKAKQAAERDARNTVGVIRVDNLLKVRSTDSMSDDFIASRIEAALVRNSITEQRKIQVEAEAGTVTLRGSVDSPLEKSEAEDVAQRARGVRLVRNQLDVENPETTYFNYAYDSLWNYAPLYGWYSSPQQFGYGPSTRQSSTGDAVVQSRIESQLFWSPFVDSDAIDVEVNDGTVTLTGSVEDFGEQAAAIENAYEGGAKYVVNELTVLPEQS
jgi:osmotically-inducible protein OsmY